MLYNCRSNIWDSTNDKGVSSKAAIFILEYISFEKRVASSFFSAFPSNGTDTDDDGGGDSGYCYGVCCYIYSCTFHRSCLPPLFPSRPLPLSPPHSPTFPPFPSQLTLVRTHTCTLSSWEGHLRGDSQRRGQLRLDFRLIFGHVQWIRCQPLASSHRTAIRELQAIPLLGRLNPPRVTLRTGTSGVFVWARDLLGEG